MSKPTASAAGEAMPAEGQPNIADAFEQTRLLIIAASNLAAALDDTQAQGLHAVICAAEDKFEVARLWFEAGHKPIASLADPDPDHELLHAVDDIYVIRCLIEAAWMAAVSLTKEECGAMQTVLNEAQQRLTAVRERSKSPAGRRWRVTTMTEATQKREGPTPEQLAQRARFERLYCDWHTARAAIDNPDLPEDDVSANARARKLDEAERALLTSRPRCLGASG